MVFKTPKGWTAATPAQRRARPLCHRARRKEPPSRPEIYRALTRLFLQSNTAQMPLAFERGLIEFFSTFEVNGIRITAGDAARRSPISIGRASTCSWSDPEYFGKTPRAALQSAPRCDRRSGLSQRVRQESPPKSRPRRRSHSRRASSRPPDSPAAPMSRADFRSARSPIPTPRLARADLLAGAQSAAEYANSCAGHEKVAEAEEGLGLLALRDRRTDEARRDFADAVEAGSTSARCYIEYAKLEPDNAKARTALLKAAGINPKLDEPFALLAGARYRSAQAPAHWKAPPDAQSAQPGLLEGAGRSLPGRTQLCRSRQGLEQRRAGGHRSDRARAYAARRRMAWSSSAWITRRPRSAARGRGKGA